MARPADRTPEIFFEDCRVPVSHLLGQEGKRFRYLLILPRLMGLVE